MTDPDFSEVERRRELGDGVHPLGGGDPLPPAPHTSGMRETEAERRFRETSRNWREHDRKERENA